MDPVEQLLITACLVSAEGTPEAARAEGGVAAACFEVGRASAMATVRAGIAFLQLSGLQCCYYLVLMNLQRHTQCNF